MADRFDRRRVWTIAMREFRQTVLTRGFFMAVVVAPIGTAVVSAGAGALALATTMPDAQEPVVGEVVIVDPTGEVGDRVAAALQPAAIEAKRQDTRATVAETFGATLAEAFDPSPPVNVTVRVERDPAVAPALQDEVRAGSRLAVVVVPDELLGPNPGEETFKLLSREGTASSFLTDLDWEIGDAVVNARLARSGQDAETLRALLRRPARWRDRAEVDVDLYEAAQDGIRLAGPMAFVTLVWFTSFLAGNLLMVATIEEKSSKVIEVLLGAVTPLELLGGKLVGYGMVAAIIVSTYGGVGLIGMWALASLSWIPWMHMPFLAICFAMAYLFEATTMAAIASAVDDLREAQTLMAPLITVSMMTMMLALTVATHPEGKVATITSFLPPFVPYSLSARVMGGGEVPVWQMVVGLAIAAAALWGVLRLTANVFRIGVLTQGRTPSFREIARWAREG
jgi:ABC-2 type transport system permease protein